MCQWSWPWGFSKIAPQLNNTAWPAWPLAPGWTGLWNNRGGSGLSTRCIEGRTHISLDPNASHWWSKGFMSPAAVKQVSCNPTQLIVRFIPCGCGTSRLCSRASVNIRVHQPFYVQQWLDQWLVCLGMLSLPTDLSFGRTGWIRG
jgi:hypothetical protein